MTPDILVKEIKSYGLSSEKIAEKVGCSNAYIIKLANGTRNQPSYALMDKLRNLHQELSAMQETQS